MMTLEDYPIYNDDPILDDPIPLPLEDGNDSDISLDAIKAVEGQWRLKAFLEGIETRAAIKRSQEEHCFDEAAQLRSIGDLIAEALRCGEVTEGSRISLANLLNLYLSMADDLEQTDKEPLDPYWARDNFDFEADGQIVAERLSVHDAQRPEPDPYEYERRPQPPQERPEDGSRPKNQPNWIHIKGLAAAQEQVFDQAMEYIQEKVVDRRSFWMCLSRLKEHSRASILRGKGEIKDSEGKPLPLGLSYGRYARLTNALMDVGLERMILNPGQEKYLPLKDFDEGDESYQDALDGPRVGLFKALECEDDEEWASAGEEEAYAGDADYESDLCFERWAPSHPLSPTTLCFRTPLEEIDRWLSGE